MAIDVNFSFEKTDSADKHSIKIWGDYATFSEIVFNNIDTGQDYAYLVGQGIVNNTNVSYQTASIAGEILSGYNYEIVVAGGNSNYSELVTYQVNLTNANNIVSQSHEVNIAASKFVWSDISTYNQKEGYTLTTQTSGVIKYPISTFKDDIVFSNKAQYNISPIYVGTWQSTLQSVITYVSNDYPIRVIETINAAKETTVDASTDLCCFNKAVQVVKDRYDNAKCKNSRLADKYMQDLQEISALYTLIQSSIACNELNNIASYVAEAKKIAEMSSGCGCNTSDGSLIVDIFGNVAYVLDGLDVNVTVTGVSPIEVTSDNDNHTVSIDINALNNELVDSNAFLSIGEAINNVDNIAEVNAIINYLYPDGTSPLLEAITSDLTADNVNDAIVEIADSLTSINSTLQSLTEKTNVDVRIPIGYSASDTFESSAFYQMHPTTYLLNTDFWGSINSDVTNVYVAPSSSGLAIFIVMLEFANSDVRPTEEELSIYADVYGGSLAENTNGLPAELKVLSHGPIGSTYYQISVGFVYNWTSPHHIANSTAFTIFMNQTFNGGNNADIVLKISRT